MSISKVLVKIDCFNDYIPIASSATNFVDIFQKCLVIPLFKINNTELNHYYKYLDNKSFTRCAVLVIPFIGNAIFGIIDCSNSNKTQNNEEAIPVNYSISLEDIEKIFVGHPLDTTPIKYTITITLKDGLRDIRILDEKDVASLVCNIPEEKIINGQYNKSLFEPLNKKKKLPDPTKVLNDLFVNLQ